MAKELPRELPRKRTPKIAIYPSVRYNNLLVEFADGKINFYSEHKTNLIASMDAKQASFFANELSNYIVPASRDGEVVDIIKDRLK